MTQQASLLASRVGAGRADGGRRWRSVDPAHTNQVVAEVMLAEPATFIDACRAARAAQPGWAATPAPVRGRVVKYLGRQRRHRLGPQRQPGRADPRRRARPGLPGLGRLAGLLVQAGAALSNP